MFDPEPKAPFNAMGLVLFFIMLMWAGLVLLVIMLMWALVVAAWASSVSLVIHA